MIIVMQHGAPKKYIQRVISEVENLGYTPHPIYGIDRTVVACVGDERGKDRIQTLDSLPGVESVVPILQPFKLVGLEAKRYRPGRGSLRGAGREARLPAPRP